MIRASRMVWWSRGGEKEGDRIILVKLVISDMVLNIINAYAPK